MKLNLLFFLMLLSPFYLNAQKWTEEETKQKILAADEMYCNSIKTFIECMIEYNETNFNTAHSNCATVIELYDEILSNGTYSSLDYSTFYFEGRKLYIHYYYSRFGSTLLYEDYIVAMKEGKRKLKVEYNGETVLIPKKLKEEYKDLYKALKEECNI